MLAPIGGVPNAVTGVGQMVSDSFVEETSKQKPEAIIRGHVCVCVGVGHGRTFQEARECKCLEQTQELEEIQGVWAPIWEVGHGKGALRQSRGPIEQALQVAL